jgi:uncharacterized membrane protein
MTAVSIDAAILVAAGLIDLGGAVVIVWSIIRASTRGVLDREPEHARVVVAEGVLSALGFLIASTLLKTIALRGWDQIGTFAFILAFRTILKRVFDAERRKLIRQMPTFPTDSA